jgi:HEAT repeat protein
LLTIFDTGTEAMLPLFGDRNAAVRAQAAEWAANHPTRDVINRLLGLLSDDARFPRFTVQDSLLRLGRAVIEPLIAYLDGRKGREVEAALTVAMGLAAPRFLDTALVRCRDGSPAVRRLAAGLVGAIGGHEGAEVLLEMLGDPVPQVRAAAAQSLGKLGYWPAAAHIAPLLRDPSWVVRLEAGQALRTLGAPGILFLRRFLADDDKFAADMARQVLDVLELQRAGRTS